MQNRKKIRNIYFDPNKITASDLVATSTNFSQLDPLVENSLGGVDEPAMIELQICQMVHMLPTDKLRCVLLFQVLRGAGFEIDHESCAKALGVELRGYMRRKAKVQKLLKKFNVPG